MRCLINVARKTFKKLFFPHLCVINIGGINIAVNSTVYLVMRTWPWFWSPWPWYAI